MKIFVDLDYKKNPICETKRILVRHAGCNPSLFCISKGVRKSPLQSSQCYQTYMFRELRHHEG